MADKYKKVISYEPKYPEADEKIAYYKEVVSKLSGFLTDAYKYYSGSLLDSYKTSTENSGAEGQYYDEYVTHKDIWFTNNTNIKNNLKKCIDDIEARKKEAQDRLDLWKIRSTETKEVITYVLVEEEEEEG